MALTAAEAEQYRRQFEQDWATIAAGLVGEPPQTAEAYRRQFEQDWESIVEGLVEEAEAPTVVPRTGSPGQPPQYAQHPEYVPPDELPPGNVSPEYDQLTKFLFGQEWLFVTSSNVNAIQYYDQEQVLYIEYKNGSVYGYTGVTLDEAIDFATAPSKGRWRHQNLPVSRNNYFIVSGPYRSPQRFAAERRRGLEKMTLEELLGAPAERVARTFNPEEARRAERTYPRTYRPEGF